MTPLHFHAVKKSYGKTPVIHGVDLTIHPGEFVVILGPSGCGKSTLLRMVAGLESITDGDILIDQQRVNEQEPRDRGCAMVFQNYALYPHMTVAENIGYALKVAGLSKAERSQRVNAVATTLGLTDLLARKPTQLSGGQRQRVAMGRAMIREPKVFLYDEPLSNLDAKLRVAMRAEIRRLHERLGTTSLFVTHDQIEAMTLADRIVVMNNGRIEQVGTPDEVYHKPASVFVAEFVGAPGVNLVKGELVNGTQVRLSDGQNYTLHARYGASGGNQSVLLGFRAEQAHCVEHGGLEARVSFIEPLGATTLVHAELAGVEVALSVPPRMSVTPGQAIRFQFSTDEAHLFDAHTGRRLEALS
jgi:sn-glycerol 3-phosphate transport system ATP-binding protein